MFNLFRKTENDPKIYSPYFSEIRKSEYFRLDNLDQVYLDYVGSNLYPQTLVDSHYNMLSEGVYGNPKADSPSALQSRQKIEQTRSAIIDYFDADDYYCIFTDNSSSMNSFRDHFPFGPDSILISSIDSASPMNSVRERCIELGGSVDYIKLYANDLTIDKDTLSQKLNHYQHMPVKLLAFPAQSSISGIKHSMSDIPKAQELGWEILLEADIYAATSRLSLKKIQPDYVSISFYKIFGYPTGIGCLLVRKDKSEHFEKIEEDIHDDTRPLTSGMTVTRLKDDSINFLEIPMIKEGLDFIYKIGIDRIQIRMEKLTNWISAKLTSIKHDNDIPLVEIYGTRNIALRGNSILLNLYDNEHEMFPLDYLNEKCMKRNISIRSGSLFENIAADEDLSHENYLSKYFTCMEPDDSESLRLGYAKISSALRLSLGIPTVQDDLMRFLDMVEALRNNNYAEILSKQK